MTTLAHEPTAPIPADTKKKVRHDRHAIWFVLPYLIIFIAMIVIPLAIGIWLSFTKGDLFGIERTVGLNNYIRLLGDPIFLQTVSNTFYFVLLTVPTLAITGLALALALNRETRWAAVLRAIFFASTVLSVTVVTLVWRLVFLPDSGLLNVVAGWFGTSAPAFLNDENLAMIAIAITTIWWCIGLPMVLFLAALQQVPRDLYEAAALDGAGRWKALRHITLPAIKRTFALVLIIEVILQFQLFGQPQLMTQGGPNNATRPVVLFIYEAGWRQWELGYAAAAAQVLFGMILVAAMIQYWITTRREDAR